VVISRDGQILASASEDETIRLWNVTPGEEVSLLRTLRGHTNRVNGVSFSADGRRLASASLDRTVKVWDVASGREALTLRGHAGDVYGVAFSPDGRFLASTGIEINLWEAIESSPEAKAERSAGAEKEPLAWHDRESWACAQGLNWFGAIFHLNRILAGGGGGDRGHFRRGYARARLGQWKEAAADYGRAVRSSPDDLYLRAIHAGLLLMAGQTGEYRKACTEALARAGPDAPFLPAYQATRLCALAPGALDDPARVVQQGERLLRIDRGPYMQHALGLCYCRAGQYEDGERCFRASLAIVPQWRGNVVNWLGLALACHHRGRPDEARQWLDRAVAWIDKASRLTDQGPEEPLGLNPVDWLACLLLRREVESLLRNEPGGVR
jgi:tetratricopeptide (TPR) repeat protein